MDKITHEVRAARWRDIVSRCQSRPAGQSISSWLAENGIPEKTYYYWQRKIRHEAYDLAKSNALATISDQSTAVSFAEIPAAAAAGDSTGFYPDAVIRIGNATVAVSNNTSAELLGRIMEAVNHAC